MGQSAMGRRLLTDDMKSDCATTTIRHKALTVDCFMDKTGKLQRKVERWCGKTQDYSYHFDHKGHLLKVLRNGCMSEQYTYDDAGRRVEQNRENWGGIELTNGPLY